MNPLIQSKNATILPVLIALTLGCFRLSSQAWAVCQEGCGLNGTNTFLGDNALVNTTNGHNTAIGSNALFSNTLGPANTAVGYFTLQGNTRGNLNTAIGEVALFSNTTGNANTATGSDALYYNHSGYQNTATGANALINNTTGNLNTATGSDALQSNTTGSGNIAVGAFAGAFLTAGDNNIDIGNLGVTGDSGAIRIVTAGTQTATFIAGIRETPLTQGVAVTVGITADGQLGVRVSSGRFKEAIKPMDKTSEAILALKPVTFRYKKEFDPKGAPQFGLVAEEVAKVNPDLVVADDQGKPFTVRYDEVNAMLLNEFLKEHRKVEEQAATIEQQERRLTELERAVAELR